MTPSGPDWRWPTDDEERRKAFRAFAREHHPDAGGDPAVFAAGLAAYRAGSRRDGDGRDEVTYGYRTRWWQLGGVTTWMGRHLQRRLRPRVR